MNQLFLPDMHSSRKQAWSKACLAGRRGWYGKLMKRVTEGQTPNFEVIQPDKITRIIIYGGSVAFHIESSKGKDWPHRMQGRLRQSGFLNAEVMNASIFYM